LAALAAAAAAALVAATSLVVVAAAAFAIRRLGFKEAAREVLQRGGEAWVRDWAWWCTGDGARGTNAHHLNVLLLRVGDVLHRHTQWICCHLALEVGIGGAHGWQEGLEAVEDCGA
jgi:hypothetical protein